MLVLPYLAEMKLQDINQQFGQQAFLLALVLFLIIPIPITLFPAYQKIIFALAYSFMVFSGLTLLYESNRRMVIGLSLGVLSFLSIWVSLVTDPVTSWGAAQSFSLFLYFSYMSYRLAQQIIKQEEMTVATLIASISGYLLIGMIGGTLFQLLEVAIPGSFNLGASTPGPIYDLHYLSFVTLTTLGFGDITPESEAAKSLTILISLAGQLYLTILIAILIGRFLR